MFYMFLSIHMICESILKDYYFGMNVLRSCRFVHLFDTPFQNSPHGYAPTLQVNLSIPKPIQKVIGQF